MSAVPSTIQGAPPSLLSKLASRFNVEPTKMLGTLKSTAFKGEVTNEQMMALLIVADQYDLNPWTKEIYAFPDKGGIVPVVGVDGWLRIINSHPQFDGMEFTDGPLFAFDKGNLPEWIEATIYRKDRNHPTRVREYMVECRRETGPWKSHPRRMLRNKVIAQGGRVAFGFCGIYDPDEAERILAARDVAPMESSSSAIATLNRQIAATDARIVKSTTLPPNFHDLEQMIFGATTLEQLAEIRNLVPSVEGADDRDDLTGMLEVRAAELTITNQEPA
jgi:phage recombination protein Bet